MCSFCYHLANNIKNAASNEEKILLWWNTELICCQLSSSMLLRKDSPKTAPHSVVIYGRCKCYLSFIQEEFHATLITLYNFFYSWSEAQAVRGSPEIVSPLYDFLKKCHWPESGNFTLLICDWSDQNKDSRWRSAWPVKHQKNLKRFFWFFQGHIHSPSISRVR